MMIIPTIYNRNYDIHFKAVQQNCKMAQRVILSEEASEIYSKVGKDLSELFPLLKTLSTEATTNNKIKPIYENLKRELKFLSIGKFLSDDAVVFKNPDTGYYLSVSLLKDRDKDKDPLLRLIDLSYQKIQSRLSAIKYKSYCCYDNQLVKNDAKHTMPKVNDLTFYQVGESDAENEKEDFEQRLKITNDFLVNLKNRMERQEIKDILNELSSKANLVTKSFDSLPLVPQTPPVTPAKVESIHTSVSVNTPVETPKIIDFWKYWNDRYGYTYGRLPDPEPEDNLVTKRKRYDSFLELRGKVEGQDLKILKQIFALYTKVYEQLNTLTEWSRNNIRNSFSESLIANHTNTRELTFGNLGKSNETYTVNIKDYQKYYCLIVFIKDNESNGKYYVLDKRQNLMENPPILLKFGKQKSGAGNKVTYYTQEEINSLNLVEKMTPLRDILIKYNEHIASRIKNINDSKVYYSNDNAGDLKEEHNKIQNILKYERTYRDYCKLLYGDKKQKYKELMKITHNIVDTRISGVVIDKLVEKGDIIRVVPRNHEGTEGFSVQILDSSNKVKKTYFILDDKLVKNVRGEKTINPSIQSNRAIYYHTQEYINNSGIKELLDVILERLSKYEEVYEQVKNMTFPKPKDLVSLYESSRSDLQDRLEEMFDRAKTSIAEKDGDITPQAERKIRSAFHDIQLYAGGKLKQLIDSI